MEKELLENNSSPLDNNIEAILPGVHSRMASTQSQVTTTNRKIDGLADNLAARLQKMEENQKFLISSVSSMMERFDNKEDQLADHLAAIVDGLRHRSRSKRVRVDDNEPQGRLEELEQSNLFPPPLEEGGEGGQEEQKVDNDSGIPVATTRHRCTYKHQSLRDIHDEWFGIGAFYNKPVQGGWEVLESQHKSRWRKHFTVSEEKAFSRLKWIVKGMRNKQSRTKESLMDVCNRWNEIYEGQCKKSLSKMEDWLKKEGIITTTLQKVINRFQFRLGHWIVRNLFY